MMHKSFYLSGQMHHGALFTQHLIVAIKEPVAWTLWNMTMLRGFILESASVFIWDSVDEDTIGMFIVQQVFKTNLRGFTSSIHLDKRAMTNRRLSALDYYQCTFHRGLCFYHSCNKVLFGKKKKKLLLLKNN